MIDTNKIAGELRAGLDGAIDRAAQHLRETLQGGKIQLPWERVSRPAKSKWVNLSAGTLNASGCSPDNILAILDAWEADKARLAAAEALLEEAKGVVERSRSHIVIHRNDFGEVMNDGAVSDLTQIDALLTKLTNPGGPDGTR